MTSQQPRPSRSVLRAFILLVLLAVPCFLVWRACRQWSLNRGLIAAIHSNDVEQVRSLLTQKADPNTQELLYYQLFQDKLHGEKSPVTSKPPALAVALYQFSSDSQEAANTEIIIALLEAGADANVRYRYGNTALMGAVWRDNPEVVRHLLKMGVDVEARNMFGATPLMQAAETDDVSLISLLLDNGADINAKDDHGFDALRFAVRTGKAKSVQRLIERKADVNARDNAGSTALTFAKQEKLPQIISLLQKAGAKE
jgi:ankyrin repeat protein